MEIHHFPTSFAKELASDVGLFYLNVFGMRSEDNEFTFADDLYGALRSFQKLSLFNPLEEALVAYTGIPLDEEQTAALTIIHASSKAWALGHVAEQLLLNMDSGDSKQMAAIASTLLEQLTSAGGAVSPAVKRYVVNLTTEAE